MKNKSLVEKVEMAVSYILGGILLVSGIGCATIAVKPKENIAKESKAAEPKHRTVLRTPEYRLPPPKYNPTPEEIKSRRERREKIEYHRLGKFKPATFKDYMEFKKQSLEKKLTIRYDGIERQVDPPPFYEEHTQYLGHVSYPIVMTEEDSPEILLTSVKYIVEDSGQIFHPFEIYPSRMYNIKLRAKLNCFYYYFNQDELNECFSHKKVNKPDSLDELLSELDKDLAQIDISFVSGKFVLGYVVYPTSTTHGMSNNIARIEDGKKRIYENAANAPAIPGKNEYLIRRKPDGKEFRFSITVPELETDIDVKPKENIAKESKAAEQKSIPPEQRPRCPWNKRGKLRGDELLKYTFGPPTQEEQEEIDQLPPKFIPDPEEAKLRGERIDKIQYHQLGKFKPATFEDYKRLKKESLERKLTIQYNGIKHQVNPPNPDEKRYAQYPLGMTKEKDIPEIDFYQTKYIVTDSGQMFHLFEIYPLNRILSKGLRSQLSPFYDYLSQDKLAELGSLDELLSKIDEELARLDISALSGKFMFGYMVHPTSTTYGMPNSIFRIEDGKRRIYENAGAAPAIPGKNEYIIRRKPDGKEFSFNIIVPEVELSHQK